jgi:penicillin-binding protein 2
VNIGIGQGDMLVTPLQLATAVSVIANRGKWVPPRMLKSGSELINGSTAPKLDSIEMIPRPVWDLVIGAMEKVVHRGDRVFGENGTAWAYIGQDVGYRMAGKSGTAQVVEIKQGEEYEAEELDERQRKHAWFVAFAPVDNPTIALAVLVENGGGGSEFAAPVARAVLDHHLIKNTKASGQLVASAGKQ